MLKVYSPGAKRTTKEELCWRCDLTYFQTIPHVSIKEDASYSPRRSLSTLCSQLFPDNTTSLNWITSAWLMMILYFELMALLHSLIVSTEILILTSITQLHETTTKQHTSFYLTEFSNPLMQILLSSQTIWVAKDGSTKSIRHS